MPCRPVAGTGSGNLRMIAQVPEIPPDAVVAERVDKNGHALLGIDASRVSDTTPVRVGFVPIHLTDRVQFCGRHHDAAGPRKDRQRRIQHVYYPPKFMRPLRFVHLALGRVDRYSLANQRPGRRPAPRLHGLIAVGD